MEEKNTRIERKVTGFGDGKNKVLAQTYTVVQAGLELTR